MHIIALMRRMFFIFLFYKSYSYEPSLRRRDEGPHEGDCLSPLLAMVDCRKKEEPLAEALRGKVGETCMGGGKWEEDTKLARPPPDPHHKMYCQAPCHSAASLAPPWLNGQGRT